MAHFTGDHLSVREMEISQQMTRIEWIETGGGTQHDLGALLTEATMVKARMPAYNRQLRKSEDVCAWRLVIDREINPGIDHGADPRIDRDIDPDLARHIARHIDQPIDRGIDTSIDHDIVHRPTVRKRARPSRPSWRLALARPDDLFFAQDPDLYGPFATPRQAGVTLRAIADAHGLRPALLKLDKAVPGKPCFSHQVKRCRGACIGLESVEEHARRLQEALTSLAIVPWPFDGPIAFREGRRLHVVDGWAYLGMADDFEHARGLAVTRRLFDHDVYRLLVRRIDALEVVRL